MADSVPGQPIAPTETPAVGSVQTPPAPEPSLLEHEQQFHETAARDDDDEEAGDAGRTLNKRRHRAKNNQAGADDVPRIQELTRKLREAEGKISQPAASATPAEPTPAKPTPSAPAVQAAPAALARQSPQVPQAFLSYEQFVTVQGNEQATYEDYTDARADWRYAMQRAYERQQDAADKAQRDYQERASAHLQRVATAKTKYPDWDTVVNAPDLPPVTFVMRDAILASNQSGDIQYFLGSHRDELATLVAESQDYSPSAVQAMRRYLDTLVASPRAAAVATGPALALVPPPAPKPPSPVRTSALTPADEPPGDTGSLYDHEKFYGTPHQRRRRA